MSSAVNTNDPARVAELEPVSKSRPRAVFQALSLHPEVTLTLILYKIFKAEVTP